MPTWVAVVFAVITPLAFTINGVLTKHLTTKEKNPFNASNLSFSSYLIVNILMMICAIPYWILVSFSLRLFVIGLIGGLINTCGLVCVQNAMAVGPAGPVSAVVAISNLLLVIVEAFKMWKVPSIFEILAFLFGAYGAVILVLPGYFERFCFCCCPFVRKRRHQCLIQDCEFTDPKKSTGAGSNEYENIEEL